MAEQSYLLQLLADYEDLGPEYKTYLKAQIKDLEKIKENYEKQFEVIDKLKVEKQHLSAYIEVLENQLDLAKTIIKATSEFNFPVFKRGDV